jgi:geranylgeranyl diphosphate synthase, type II
MPTPSASSFDLAAMFAPNRAVEAYLAECLDRRPLPANLREAARYSLLGPGKRLRPILVVRSCEAVGGTLDQALSAAAAIEMIHCFSLIHDDLPAMDDDDLRRGRPTLHKHTNEAMAILAGDLLQGLAFEVLAERLSPPELAAAVMAELAQGTNDMIAGQVYDTLPDFAPGTPPLQRLQTIHRNKTGALIRCACRMGGLCGLPPERDQELRAKGYGQLPSKAPPEPRQAAGAKRSDAPPDAPDDSRLSPLSIRHPPSAIRHSPLAALTRYAEAIGLMFQVVDDLLDVTQTTAQLGKTAGKDAQQNKMTYPGLIGIEASKAEVVRLHKEAHAALEPLGERAGRLRELCDFMAVREK